MLSLASSAIEDPRIGVNVGSGFIKFYRYSVPGVWHTFGMNIFAHISCMNVCAVFFPLAWPYSMAYPGL